MTRRRGGVIVVTDFPKAPALGEIPVRTADDYLAGEPGTLDERLTIVNLCRSYQYLSKGYYVSLLADARHHRAIPSLETIQAINDPFVYFRSLEEAGLDTIDFRLVRGGNRLLPRIILPDYDAAAPTPNGESDALVESSDPAVGARYRPAAQPHREITSVVGRSTDPKFQRVCATIYRVFPVPLLKVRLYENVEDGTWEIGQIFPVALGQATPEDVRLLAAELTKERITRTPSDAATVRPYRIACLWDERDPNAPSDEATLEKFERAATRQNALFEIIGKEDLDSLAEYDALFIRTATAIDHYSFTFARTAESFDIPVIDDPRSIVRCTNKVFLHELFEKNGVPTPSTAIISRKTPDDEIAPLGFPLVVKQPDGTFSDAVKKASDRREFEAICQEMFRKSPLLIVQQFTPTPFDWRIGVLEGRFLFAAKYHMAKDHWQIVGHWKTGRRRYGKVEAVAADAVPEAVLRIALDAAGLVGDGLYGVDVKETAGGPRVIEVNDNPNIVETDEDAVERDRMYDAVILALIRRIQRSRQEAFPA